MRKTLALLLLLAVAVPVLGQAKKTDRAMAYYHFSKGRLLDDEGNWNLAINEFKKALEYDSDNSLIYSEMAATYLNNRRIREAIENAEKAIQIDANNLEAHKLLGSLFTNFIGNPQGAAQLVTGDLVERAIKEFEEIVRIDPNDRQAYLTLARLFQVKNQPARASEVYKRYLAIDPGSEEGAVGLATLQMGAGNPQEAISVLEKFVQDHPDSDRALETLGQAYGAADQPAKAVEAFRKALEVDQDNVEARKGLAQGFFEEEKYDDAAREYKKVVAADANDGLALLRLGQIYRAQRKYDEARENLQKAMRAFPDSIEVQFNMTLLDRDEGFIDESARRLKEILTRTERQNGRYSDSERQNRRVFLFQFTSLNASLDQFDEAIRGYNELKALTPDNDGRIDAMIVDVYRTQKKLDKALEESERALKEKPDSRALQIVHADLTAEKGRLDEGAGALEKLLKGSDDDLDVFATMLSVYQRAKRFSDAEKVMARILKQFPKHEHAYFLQGALLERQKKFDAAEKAFRKALELEADNPAAQNYLGYMLADNDLKLEEALSLIQKAVESDPANGAYLDSLGWAYFKLNKLDQAEDYLKRALRFSHRDPTIHEHLGDLYFKTNRIDQARAEWTKSLELATDQEEVDKAKKKLDSIKNRVAQKK